MNKKGTDSLLPEIAVIILVVIVVVLLVIWLYPHFKEGYMFISNLVIALLGLNQGGDKYIRSFDVTRDLAGGLTLRYRFINSFGSDGSSMVFASYQINATWKTGKKIAGVVDEWASEEIFGEVLDKDKAKDYMQNSKEVTFKLDSPAALNAKKYVIYAFDRAGNILEHKDLDYLGVFPEQPPTKFLPNINSFMDLAESLKGLGSDTSRAISYNQGLVMVGFSKDFQDGKGLIKRFSWYSGTFGCGSGIINPPKECSGQNTCLCLCMSDGNDNRICSDDTGRICYGYPEYGFIGGARRTCGTEGWFGKSKGMDGEDNNLITLWNGAKLDNKDEKFNSLAMSITDDKDKQLPLDIGVSQNDMGGGKSVKMLTIKKVDPSAPAKYSTCGGTPNLARCGEVKECWDYMNVDLGCDWEYSCKTDACGSTNGKKCHYEAYPEWPGSADKNICIEEGKSIGDVCLPGKPGESAGVFARQGDYHWSDTNSLCYHCYGLVGLPQTDLYGWAYEPGTDKDHCI